MTAWEHASFYDTTQSEQNLSVNHSRVKDEPVFYAMLFVPSRTPFE